MFYRNLNVSVLLCDFLSAHFTGNVLTQLNMFVELSTLYFYILKISFDCVRPGLLKHFNLAL